LSRRHLPIDEKRPNREKWGPQTERAEKHGKKDRRGGGGDWDVACKGGSEVKSLPVMTKEPSDAKEERGTKKPVLPRLERKNKRGGKNRKKARRGVGKGEQPMKDIKKLRQKICKERIENER